MSRLIFVLLLITAGCSTGAEAIDTGPATLPATAPTIAVIEAPSSTTSTTAPVPVVLIFGGDVSLTHGLAAAEPFGEIAGILALADLSWVNLESAVAEGGVGTSPEKEYVFRSPPETVELLAAAGVDGVALANNHALDAGLTGLQRTLELLGRSGVSHAGAGLNSDQAYAASSTMVGSTSVAVVAFSRVLPATSWAATETNPGLASAYHPFVERSNAAVAEADRVADIVVVMVHWGVERASCPEDYQRELAAGWAAAGADLIVGSHPHVLQGVERIDDTWVVYSTGNLAFPSAYSEDTTQSALFEATIAGGEIVLRALPLRIIDGRPVPAADADRAMIIETLNARSWSVSLDTDGHVSADGSESACR